MLNLFLCGFGLKGASSKGDRITGSSLIYAECFFFLYLYVRVCVCVCAPDSSAKDQPVSIDVHFVFVVSINRQTTRVTGSRRINCNSCCMRGRKQRYETFWLVDFVWCACTQSKHTRRISKRDAVKTAPNEALHCGLSNSIWDNCIIMTELLMLHLFRSFPFRRWRDHSQQFVFVFLFFMFCFWFSFPNIVFRLLNSAAAHINISLSLLRYECLPPKTIYLRQLQIMTVSTKIIYNTPVFDH